MTPSAATRRIRQETWKAQRVSVKCILLATSSAPHERNALPAPGCSWPQLQVGRCVEGGRGDAFLLVCTLLHLQLGRLGQLTTDCSRAPNPSPAVC